MAGTENFIVDFYLNRGGRNEGPFPLYELRRRREAGELGGSEYVWREGMANWQFLDDILSQNSPAGSGPLPPPVPLPAWKRPVNQGTNWGVVTAFSLFVILIVGGIIFGMTHRSLLLPTLNPAIGRDGRPYSPTGMAEASKPVTWTKHTLTATDIQKQHRNFRLRQWVEGYQERGDRSEACDADAVEFLKTWIDRTYGGPDDTNTLTLAQWGDKLANDPACTDPLVLTIAGENSIELHERARRLQRALDGFANSKHRA
jgi:hypothetical protein